MNVTDAFNAVRLLSPDETESYFQNNPIESYTLLDVRQPKEYEAGHIPGAVLVPLPELSDRLSEISRDLPVIAYCRSGQRSYAAASLLKGAGFQEVYSLEGGMNAWEGLEAQGAYEAGLYLLEDVTGLDELITLGWAMEDGTGRFYREAERLLNPKHRAQGELFLQLAQAESRHKENLMDAYESIFGSKALKGDVLAKYGDLMEGGVSVGQLLNRIKSSEFKEINLLEIAMQIETNSLDLYLKIHRRVEGREAKDIMTRLIEEEKVHLKRLGEAIEGLNI
jgi:rhodanese-related sulfurtransferase/rubrerythrin